MSSCQTQLLMQTDTASADGRLSQLETDKLTNTVNTGTNTSITLDSIFPTTQGETKTQRAKRMLGETTSGMSDGELETHITKFEYLIDCWLDSYEKEVFDGKTLNQLLREG